MNTPKIHVLPVDLVNKIAAGEVVERPASVVKEAVENALDAEAKRIAVHVEEGGRKLIRITDDGCGMGPDDLAWALKPHSTSKLNSDADLAAIRTLGFRGEALASIASVAQVRLTSRPPDEAAGTVVLAEGGREDQPQPVGAPPGTCVEVRNLFFNVPARRKFLRAPQTEMTHVTEQFMLQAMGHPQVHFTLSHSKRDLYQLPPASDRRRRITELFGEEIGSELLAVECEKPQLTLQAWIGTPAIARPNTKMQYFFVNGRAIRDRYMGHALREAYRGMLDKGRSPVAFVFLTVDPTLVDVNVHPTKSEVRWRDSNRIHSLLLGALREKFLTTDLTPRFQPPQPPAATEQSQSTRAAMADFFKSIPPLQGTFPSQAPFTKPASSLGGQASSPPAAPMAQPKRQEQTPSAPPPFSAGGHSFPSERKKSLQLHDAYLVTPTDDGLMIVDQHALHERMLYQQLTRRLTEGKLDAQQLLIPEPLDVTPEQLRAAQQATDLLDKLGFQLTELGPDCLGVNTVPMLLCDAPIAELVLGILNKLAESSGQADSEELLGDVVEMMACKAAVKAGQHLSDSEIEDLLARREELEGSATCPHGRPTTLKLTLRDLEKQFKRT